MNIKSSSIPSFELKVFDEKCPHFWMGTLNGLLTDYPFMSDAHQLNAYTIIFNEKYNGYLQVDQHRVELNPSTVAFRGPGNVMSLHTHENASGTILCFTESFFSLRYNNNVLHRFEWLKYNMETITDLSEQQFGKCKTIFHYMSEEFLQENEHHEKVLRSFLNILLFELDKGFDTAINSTRLTNGEEKMIQFEKLIDTHYQKEKSPSWYAAELHISVNYLNKLCQNLRNSTSGEIIRKRVLVEAKKMLYHTSLSVGEIAYELGFDSFSYFITFFRKQTGITPEVFRKNTD